MIRLVEASSGTYSFLEDGVIQHAFYSATTFGIGLEDNQSIEKVDDVTTLPQRFQAQLQAEANFDVLEGRRAERTTEFALTLDKVNPWWYNAMTETQRTQVATWRQEWLDYPATDSRPTRPEVFKE